LLKLHQIYFRRLFLLFAVLFVIVGGVIYYRMQDLYISNIKEALKEDIKLIELSVDMTKDFDKLAKRIKKDLGVRVTFVDESGKVLGESDKDRTTMDNHKYRPEIMQAKKEGFGSSVRRSATLNKNLLYMAGSYKVKGKMLFIRLSKEIKKIHSHLLTLGGKIAFVLILFVLILFYIIYTIGKDIEKEVNKIAKFLINLTKKKKKLHITSEFSEEFYKITKLLTKVANILSKRDKQKAKYTAKLKSSNKQKDDIISAISHEFKNPITVINGYSKTLLDDESIDKQIERKFLEKIYQNGQKLTELIDTLRLSIKLEGKNIKTNFTKFSLYDLVAECADSLKTSYKDRDIVIKKEFDKEIEADRVLLGVAISNLIENAVKYSEDSVEITIDKDFLSVKDEGIGLDQKEIKNITKKFYRVSKNSWDNSLGLGLNIVSNILELHGFGLEIVSEKDKGSEFRVIFER